MGEKRLKNPRNKKKIFQKIKDHENDDQQTKLNEFLLYKTTKKSHFSAVVVVDHVEKKSISFLFISNK